MGPDIVDFVRRYPNLVVVTGAGCSASSGIPVYRNAEGEWLRAAPIQHGAFVGNEASRQRYWARSFAGWPVVRDAAPNSAHGGLRQLESRGYIKLLITQNIDGLHQKAGHRVVVDLHGRLDRVVCLGCGELTHREAMQERLAAANGVIATSNAESGPDGDAMVEVANDFVVPQCERCGGILKPDVVFFGGSVPGSVVATNYAAVEQADALLVVGSSLTVFSGFRFCRHAARLGKPVAIINKGKTRADDIAAVKYNTTCEDAIDVLVQALG